jgi:hypothetical protein
MSWRGCSSHRGSEAGTHVAAPAKPGADADFVMDASRNPRFAHFPARCIRGGKVPLICKCSINHDQSGNIESICVSRTRDSSTTPPSSPSSGRSPTASIRLDGSLGLASCIGVLKHSASATLLSWSRSKLHHDCALCPWRLARLPFCAPLARNLH